mgnify:CR=1 FL=1
MTGSHAAGVAVYAFVAVLGVIRQVLGLRPGSRVPPFGALLTRVMHPRPGRVGASAARLWLGLHFFAR